MFKRAKVVMLPTNEKANECPILYFSKAGRLNVRGYSDEELQAGKGLVQLEYTTNHIYITSNDEIREGDWWLEEQPEFPVRVCQCVNNSFPVGAKKIIATTDILPDYKAGIEVGLFLPQPSQPFIEKYVEQYNKGNIITDVLVEYKETCLNDNDSSLKVTPKDNTITIKKVKDSWSREEVEEITKKAVLDYTAKGYSRPISDWHKENL